MSEHPDIDSHGGPHAEAPQPTAGRHPVRDLLAYDRTQLANERTLAAWLRTGLTIAAGGIAVAHLVPESSPRSLLSLALGAVFVVLGVGVMGYGAVQFARVSKRLSRAAPRRAGMSTPGVYVLTAILAVLLLAVLWFLWVERG